MAQLADHGLDLGESGTRPKILLVDDDHHLLELMATVLEGHGCQVHLASEGRNALDIYRRHLLDGDRFHLVLLDYSMPGLDGDQTMRQILEMDANARVVITTGHLAEYLDSKMVQERAQAILPKPFTIQGLLTQVSNAMHPMQAH